MRAAVLERAGTVNVRDVPRPAAAGRALVRVGQAGLCGTDVKIVNGGIPVAVPRVLGHEMTGWVAQSSRLPAGTPVLVNPASFCGLCDLCRRDLPQLCRHGALPDGVAGTGLLQVLSTCVHAQSGLPELDSAVVVGLGVAGLLHLQLLALRGTGTLIGISRSAAKRELALTLGATVVAAPEAADGLVADATGGRGAGLAVECAGTPETLALAMRLAGPGGTVLAFGIIPAAAALPTYEWYVKELTIRSPRAARPRDCDTAVALAASGRLALAPLVTARFPLADAARALAACAAPGQLKVLLEVA
jgi:L-iditol 2-dehydrogenase